MVLLDGKFLGMFSLAFYINGPSYIMVDFVICSYQLVVNWVGFVKLGVLSLIYFLGSRLLIVVYF